eukprot:1096501-Amphidinium_carterae.1
MVPRNKSGGEGLTSTLQMAQRHSIKPISGSCTCKARCASRKFRSKYERNWKTACGGKRRSCAVAAASCPWSSSYWLFCRRNLNTSFAISSTRPTLLATLDVRGLAGVLVFVESCGPQACESGGPPAASSAGTAGTWGCC